MALNVTQVHRKPQATGDVYGARVRGTCSWSWGWQPSRTSSARFLHREMLGIPMNVFLQYVVPLLAVPFLILFKYGKPRGYLYDCFGYYSKPRVYCGLESDTLQQVEYLRAEEHDGH